MAKSFCGCAGVIRTYVGALETYRFGRRSQARRRIGLERQKPSRRTNRTRDLACGLERRSVHRRGLQRVSPEIEIMSNDDQSVLLGIRHELFVSCCQGTDDGPVDCVVSGVRNRAQRSAERLRSSRTRISRRSGEDLFLRIATQRMTEPRGDLRAPDKCMPSGSLARCVLWLSSQRSCHPSGAYGGCRACRPSQRDRR